MTFKKDIVKRIEVDFGSNSNEAIAVADLCFKALISTSEPVAIKAFSITVLGKICKHYPRT